MTNVDNRVAEEFIRQASDFATEQEHEYVTSEHLLLVMLKNEDVINILTECDVDTTAVGLNIASYLDKNVQKNSAVFRSRLTNTIQNILQNAIRTALTSGRVNAQDIVRVDANHILQAILLERENPASFYLQKNGLTPLALKTLAVAQDSSEDETQYIDPRMMGLPQQMQQQAPGQAKMTEKRARKVLEDYTELLNESARNNRIDPLIGREKEVFETSKIITRRRKNNVLLVGEPGVGKTAIAEGLAKLIEENRVSPVLKGAQIYALDIGALMAGTRYRGDFEERIKEVLKSLEYLGEKKGIKTILFIDEIHMMMGAGAGGEAKSMDLANLLKPYLSKGTLRCIGSTTNDEYRKHFEKDRALIRRFLKIDVYEPSEEDTIRILQGLAKSYEEFHGLTYTDAALRSAVKLSVQHISNRFLPDKAIDVIDSVGAHQQVLDESVRTSVIDTPHIENEIALMTNRPINTVKEDDRVKLKNIDPDLRAAVYGQDAAIDTLVDSVFIARAGMRDHRKPEGSFLFVGPTGVGKTETAKQLAETLGIHFERIDMSEYMEKHSVSKLIGSPPGYVGYDDNGGRLINVAEEHPHCVLLLDEVEKAHPDVLNILLQVMDDGRLTNSHGKAANFKNVILIMTSNAGAKDAQKGSIGFGRKTHDESKQDEAIKQAFPPEFLNRLDAIVMFNELGKDQILLIVDKFINQLNLMTLENNVTVEIDTAAKQWLADKGFDPLMGARPLNRVIHNSIKRPLSREILFGGLVGGGHVKVSVESGELKFEFIQAEVKESVDSE